MTKHRPELQYAMVRTGEGWIGVAVSRRGVRATTLPQPTAEHVLDILGQHGELVGEVDGDGDLADRLRRYFDGERVQFPDELDLEGLTPFQQAALEAARRIPYGETRSYGRLASEVDGGMTRRARAVGQAMARNPVPIIVPCHRVVGSDGSLTGFGGGLGLKRRMLDLEKRGR